MRRLLVIIIAILAMPFAPVFAQTKSADDAEEVKRLEMERVKALVGGDLKTLERVLSDDLVYTHSTSRVDTKAEFIESLKSGAVKYEQMNHQDLQARAYKDTVVLTGRSDVRVRANGDEINLRLRILIVYVRRGGHWQMVSWQSTRLPAQ